MLRGPAAQGPARQGGRPGPAGRSGKMRAHARARPRHAIRAQSDRWPAPRQRPHGVLQPPAGPRDGWADGAAHRGHRCRTERRAPPVGIDRRPALARNCVARGPRRRRSPWAVPAERAPGAARRGGRGARSGRPGLSVLLFAGDARDLAQGTACRGPTAALSGHLRGARRGRGCPARRGRAAARDSFPRRAGPYGRVRRRRARRAAIPDRRHRRFHRHTGGWLRGVLPRQCTRRRRHGRDAGAARR